MTALRVAERKFKGKGWEQRLEQEVLTLGSPRLRLVGHVDEDEVQWLRPGAPIYEVDGIDGFKYIPGALTEDQQVYWIEACLTRFMRPPNLNNLDALYGDLPSEGLYNHPHHQISVQKKDTMETVIFERLELLRRLRWTTLGYQYDWTSKTYVMDRDPVPFPADLASWSAAMARATNFGPNFKAQAGIVNYYQLEDTLTSHVDRSEPNMEAPLLSMSLGCSAVFLVGGVDREAPVTALLLRSGDVSILAGPSRRFFHGVPRVVPESCPEHLHCIEAVRHARINLNIRQVTD
jgi:alkylated DNA repair protein alkB family protein 1